MFKMMDDAPAITHTASCKHNGLVNIINASRLLYARDIPESIGTEGIIPLLNLFLNLSG